MQRNTRTLAIVALVVALLAIAGTYLFFGPAAQTQRGDDAARNVMMEFGTKLKNVSLTADAAAVTIAIEEQYGPYVTPELLADWKAQHAHAPGRRTSSPMPDRLGIATITTQGAGRVISGEVILVTSADAAGETADTVPFVAQVIETEDGWKIAAYQEETVQTLKKIPTSDVDIPGAR